MSDVYHVDVTSGNDANDGSSWGLAKKTIDAAIGWGREIRVAPGVYPRSEAPRPHTPLTLNGVCECSIRGAGVGATKIDVGGDYDAIWMDDTDTGTLGMVTIEDLSIVTDSARTRGAGIAVQPQTATAGPLYFRRIHFIGLNGGFNLNNSYVCYIDDCYFDAQIEGGTTHPPFYGRALEALKLTNFVIAAEAQTITGDGIVLDTDCYNIDLKGVEGNGVTGAGLRIKQEGPGGFAEDSRGPFAPTMVRVQGVFELCGVGIQLDSGLDCHFYASAIGTSGAQGVLIGAAARNTSVEGVTSYGNASDGFDLRGRNRIGLTGCKAFDNGGSGFVIADDAEHVRVVACAAGGHDPFNTFGDENPQAVGLSIGTGTDYIVAQGCDLTGNRTNLVDRSSGAHNQIGNNIV